MKLQKTIGVIFGLTLLLFISCKDPEGPSITGDNFDRSKMLQDWADLMIMPALDVYVISLGDLVIKKDDFLNQPTDNSLSALRISFVNAYKTWQRVSMFDIGKAEEIALRNFTNLYPTDVSLIQSNINAQSYNLELPSNYVAQGFPALDYLLYGIANNDSEIINLLGSNEYGEYLDDVVSRLNSLATIVLDDWQNGYRESFISNDGASATASVDKLVNDYLYYYEKFLRAGKVGIPAGVFSSNPIPTSVEAAYSKVYSKELFFESFRSVQKFFKGESFDELSKGESLQDYLIYVMEQNQTANLSQDIIDQWTVVTTTANQLSANFEQQVIDDNIKMLETYDELQKAVVLLKVDMMQALNIQVDYVDADGD